MSIYFLSLHKTNRIRFTRGAWLLAFLLMAIAGPLQAAVGGLTIGGCVYEGSGTVTLGTAVYAPNAATPAIPDAQVLIQNQHSGGKFVAYGTMGSYVAGVFTLGAGNCWEAVIPDTVAAGTPDVPDLIALFSATGHSVTSREFTWNGTDFIHPTGPDIGAGGDGTVSAKATGPQDAYMPAVPLPDGHRLHYVHYDNFVDGNSTGATDYPLNGATVRFFDEDGGLVATAISGAADITTTDGMVLTLADQTAFGYVYVTVPGNAEYYIEVDPSTITQAANPHFQLWSTKDPTRVTHDATEVCADAAGHNDYSNPLCNWYQTYTEEGGHVGEGYIWPSDPGTGFITWSSFIEKIGSPADSGSPFLGSISGAILDADGFLEPIPANTIGGRISPTNARYGDGTPWCSTQMPCAPGTPRVDVTPNGVVGNTLLALFTDVDGVAELVATAEGDPTDYFNSPDGGDFLFSNIPAGDYTMYAFTKKMYHVPNIGIGVTVTPGGNTVPLILLPGFVGKVGGIVTLGDGVTPVAGVEVKSFWKAGTTKDTQTTDTNGWFLYETAMETGQMGHVYVDLQDGAPYRGQIITEAYQGYDPVTTLPYYGPAGIDVTHNAMNRPVQWWTVNYFADLRVETIPAGVGNLLGVVFNDHFSSSTVTATTGPTGNGVYDEAEDRLWQGADTELYATTFVDTNADLVIDAIDRAAGCASLAAALPAPTAIAKTGKLNDNDSIAMGWVKPYTYPGGIVGMMGETGGVYASPVTYDGTSPTEPAVGFYEYRDVAPGDYCVRVVPGAGFRHSPDTNVEPGGLKPVVIADGLNSRVDLGVNTTNTAVLGGLLGDGVGACVGADPLALPDPILGACDQNTGYSCSVDADCVGIGYPFGVKMAGEMEGGVWKAIEGVDPNPTSLLGAEQPALIGASAAAYDHNGYFIGVMFQGDPQCNEFNNALHIPGDTTDPFSCLSTTNTIQKPEAERRFLPGVTRVQGNDPAFLWTDWDPTIPSYDPLWSTPSMGYHIPQAGYAFEKAWNPSPFPGPGTGLSFPICAIDIAGVTFSSEPWGADVTFTVHDGYNGVVGAQVSASGAGQTNDCITGGTGQCTINFEKFEGAGDSETITIVGITPSQAWYTYNTDPGGPLAGACKTSVVLYDPDFVPPVAQCNDGIDNDGDGLIDLADPGCVDILDDDETDPPQCSDGVDNDGDGLTDFPADPGCASATDNDETDAVYQCSDGVDNDGDGLIDMLDPGCASLTDNDETDPPPPAQCADGLDNDGDGLIDLADPGCVDALDNDETDPPLPQCSDGLDNDGDGLIDLADPGCTDALDNSEINAQCNDGLDNDGDGLIDMLDPGCASLTDNDEFNTTGPTITTEAVDIGEGKWEAMLNIDGIGDVTWSFDGGEAKTEAMPIQGKAEMEGCAAIGYDVDGTTGTIDPAGVVSGC